MLREIELIPCLIAEIFTLRKASPAFQPVPMHFRGQKRPFNIYGLSLGRVLTYFRADFNLLVVPPRASAGIV